MTLTDGSKRIANTVRRHSNQIRPPLRDAFEDAIVGCGMEVDFFDPLVSNVQDALNGLYIPGVRFDCRIATIHNKPIVDAGDFSCELGDLAVVIKYHPDDNPTEAKSIIYQVKLGESRKPTRCKIDQNQLELLTAWPTFEFGRQKDGGTQSYTVKPNTLEFGSYMLEPRSPQKGDHRSGKPGAYGISPDALTTQFEGPKSINLDSVSYVRSDSQALFSQIAFEIGEHHQNWEVHRLMTALYRYVGLKPDPPDEFEGFTEATEEDGFAILEINISESEE